MRNRYGNAIGQTTKARTGCKRGGPADRHPFFIINQFPSQINANNKAGAHTVVKSDRNTEAVIDRILTFQAVCALSSSAKRPSFIDLIKQSTPGV